MLQRKAGVLLHPTSLPSRYGIGDLGYWAYRFVDFLAQAQMRLWQILPLVPPGAGESPYSSSSAFAGNPLLISLEKLQDMGYLSQADLSHELPEFHLDRVEFDRVKAFKIPLIQKAISHFISLKHHLMDDFKAFQKAQAYWLEDSAIFHAISHEYPKRCWWEWETALAMRDEKALTLFKKKHADTLLAYQVEQYFFEIQWQALRAYAHEHGIEIIGDLPIYVDGHSADVWVHRQYFELAENGKASVVAGVPPDAFSATGQLWGNPLYRWSLLAQDDYLWWQHRLDRALSLTDVLRIDHFRAFAAYWEIPADAKSAMEGKWVNGPGLDFFEKIAMHRQQKIFELPLIAEDLGVIDQAVIDLLESLALPGMKILQFAFGEGNQQPYLPHMHRECAVVYTGTHDNDTTVSWWQNSSEEIKAHVRQYLGISGDDIAWHFNRLALSSVSRWAILTLQDMLSLGNDARMNQPSIPNGNWSWRVRKEALNTEVSSRFSHLVSLYGRNG
jgi:4-alpha-glucanotransferase